MAEAFKEYSVKLSADTAQFQAGMTRATASARQAQTGISGAFAKMAASVKASVGSVGALTAALAAAGAALGVAGFARDAILAAGELQDLSEATGSTVEELSRLKNIAAIGGQDFEKFKSAIERLAAGMSGAEEGSSKTAQALKFLGVTASNPAVALEEVARKLDKFSDGASKAAIAKDLFGKGGVALISTLKDIVQYSDQAATVTSKQAEEATRLADAYRRLQVSSNAIKNSIVSELVPALANLLEEFVEGKRLAGGFFEALRLFGTINPFKDTATNVREITANIEEMQRVAAKGRAFDWFHELPADIADARKKLEFLKFQQRQQALSLISDDNLDARDLKARQKPALGYRSDGVKAPKGALDDPAQKLLQGRLQAIQAESEKVRDGLKFESDLYDRFFADNIVGYQDYFARRAALQQEDLRATMAAIDQEVAALREYQQTVSKTDTDRQDKENQIQKLLERRGIAEREAGQAATLASLDGIRAAKDYARIIEDLNIRVQELSGDTAGAFAARLKQQNEALRAALQASGDIQGLAVLDRSESLANGQARLNKAEGEFRDILTEVGLQQRLINAERFAGNITELQALGRLGTANAGVIEQLKAIADGYEATAKATGNDALLKRVAELRVEIAELGAQTNLVAKQFNDIFVNSFSDAFADVIDGTKSVKDAFKDMERSIVQAISRIAAQNIAESIFGKSGATGGGIGAIIAKLLGMFAGAGGISAGSGQYANGLAGYAAGTNFAPGGMAMVGERGPEIVNLPRGSQVIPNHMLGASNGGTYNITVNPPAGMSRQSAQQFAVQIGSDLNRRMKRA